MLIGWFNLIIPGLHNNFNVGCYVDYSMYCTCNRDQKLNFNGFSVFMNAMNAMFSTWTLCIMVVWERLATINYGSMTVWKRWASMAYASIFQPIQNNFFIVYTFQHGVVQIKIVLWGLLYILYPFACRW